LRDRALIALLIYSFARISAALEMNVGDYDPQGKRGWVRLHEKGGKEHDMPAHHLLEQYLDAYVGPIPTVTLVANSMFEERSLQRRPPISRDRVYVTLIRPARWGIWRAIWRRRASCVDRRRRGLGFFSVPGQAQI